MVRYSLKTEVWHEELSVTPPFILQPSAATRLFPLVGSDWNDLASGGRWYHAGHGLVLLGGCLLEQGAQWAPLVEKGHVLPRVTNARIERSAFAKEKLV